MPQAGRAEPSPPVSAPMVAAPVELDAAAAVSFTAGLVPRPQQEQLLLMEMVVVPVRKKPWQRRWQQRQQRQQLEQRLVDQTMLP